MSAHQDPRVPSSTEESLPEFNCFFVTGGRHDKDRIEIQIGFDGIIPQSKGHFVYDVDALVFVPKTLGVTDVPDIATLHADFQSYIRLHTHVTDPKSETSVTRVHDRLRDLKSDLSLEHLRGLAIDLEGYLKAQTKRLQKRHIAPGLVSAEIDSVGFLIDDFRSILRARGLEGVRPDKISKGLDHDLLVLNEYISHVYVQYLSEVYEYIRERPEVSSAADLLDRQLKQEADIRQIYGLLLEERHGPKSTQHEDLYLRRISILKKYFHSPLFVETKSQSLQKKMLIPVYSISAALAASWAIMIQIYQTRSMMERVGINSILLITIGVVAYVLKDLMKDFFRRYFFQTSTKYFPDFERKLFLKTRGKRNRLGKIKEFIRAFDAEKVEPRIRAQRYSNFGGEIEAALNEDVVYFKKRVVLNLGALHMEQEFPFGLREVIRYRFDRLLISMEDPFKQTHLLSSLGTPTTRQAHRVYHVYFAIWIHKKENLAFRDLTPVRPAFKAYRITLDKEGILSCKQVPWAQDTPFPNYD